MPPADSEYPVPTSPPQSNVNLPTTSSRSRVCPNFTRTLSRGSRGNDVLSLQQFLITLRYMTSDSATGFFGENTVAAIQKWQSSIHIISAPVSSKTSGFGVVGPRTRSSISERCQALSPRGKLCPPVPPPEPCPKEMVLTWDVDRDGCRIRQNCVAKE